MRGTNLNRGAYQNLESYGGALTQAGVLNQGNTVYILITDKNMCNKFMQKTKCETDKSSHKSASVFGLWLHLSLEYPESYL